MYVCVYIYIHNKTIRYYHTDILMVKHIVGLQRSSCTNWPIAHLHMILCQAWTAVAWVVSLMFVSQQETQTIPQMLNLLLRSMLAFSRVGCFLFLESFLSLELFSPDFFFFLCRGLPFCSWIWRSVSLRCFLFPWQCCFAPPTSLEHMFQQPWIKILRTSASNKLIGKKLKSVWESLERVWGKLDKDILNNCKQKVGWKVKLTYVLPVSVAMFWGFDFTSHKSGFHIDAKWIQVNAFM